MNLSCVRVKCNKCGAETFLSFGAVARLLARPLTDHTAALIPSSFCCTNCGYKDHDIYYAHSNTVIVKAASTPQCKVCNSFIPEPFLREFPNARFCPLCVAEDRVADVEIIAANGTLFPGEAFRKMSFQFRYDESVRLKWLRKAVEEGDLHSCSALGDVLSESEDAVALAEAVQSYKKAAQRADPDYPVRYSQHKLALMLLKGKGAPLDHKAAFALMEAAGKRGADYALTDLGQMFLRGKYGVPRDLSRAFHCFNEAIRINDKNLTASGAVALMLLQGIGVKPDVQQGELRLKQAIGIFAGNKPNFDQCACFKEVWSVLGLADHQMATLLWGRQYLNRLHELSVPGADDLLKRCGGPLPAREQKWQISLSLPDRIAGGIFWVQFPTQKRPWQTTVLGQIEWLPNGRWISTTAAGMPIAGSFKTDKDAVNALKEAAGCDVPYTSLQERIARRNDIR